MQHTNRIGALRVYDPKLWASEVRNALASFKTQRAQANHLGISVRQLQRWIKILTPSGEWKKVDCG